jgi:hypothetical protein
MKRNDVTKAAAKALVKALFTKEKLTEKEKVSLKNDYCRFQKSQKGGVINNKINLIFYFNKIKLALSLFLFKPKVVSLYK